MSKWFNLLLRAGALSLALSFATQCLGQSRVIRMLDMTVGRGQTNRLHVELESLGDECVLGFTICFDTNYLTLVRAVPGGAFSDVFPAPSFSTNLTAASQGRLGMTISLNTSLAQTWPAGTNRIVEVFFRAEAGVGPATTFLSFCENPVPLDVLDPEGHSLGGSYPNATVFIREPCIYSLNTNGMAFSATNDVGSVNVTTDSNCDWFVENTNAWITVTSALDFTGTGTVDFTIADNEDPNPRSGVIIIAGQTFTVNQAGFPCLYSISPTSLSHPYGPSTNPVLVTASNQCNWTLVSSNSWITFPGGTNGAGTLTKTYVVDANPIPVLRTGIVMVADQILTVIQDPAPCSYELAPSSVSHGFGTETGLVSVTAYDTCAWTAAAMNTWITIDTGASGTGNGTVGYSIESNPTGLERLGALTIAGQTFILTQSPAPCTFTLAPTNHVHSFNFETSTVNVMTLTGCVWTASNTNTWIAIESSTAGSVTYSVSSNTSTFQRTATIVIADEPFQVTQDGTPCSYRWSLTNVVHSFSSTNDSVVVLSESNCVWAVENTNSWITLIPPTNGTGNATIDYTLATNATGLARTGLVTVTDQVFTIVQQGTPCSFAVAPSQATHEHMAATNSLELTTLLGCAWDVVNTNEWIHIQSATSGTSNATITYRIDANTTVFDRVGVVLIGGEVFTVTQYGESCVFDVSPLSLTHDPGTTTGLVSVTTQNGCVWTASNTNTWITIFPNSNNTNSGSATYILEANLTILARTGLVIIANQVVELIQNGAPCSYDLSVTNLAHSFNGATNSILLTTLAGCPWTVLNTNDWITFDSPTNGVSTTNLNYVVAVNPFSVWRTGVVTVANQLLTFHQEPTPCLYSLFPTNASHSAASENGLFAVTSGVDCVWTAAGGESWIIITPPTNGIGSGEVRYTVTANPTALTRTGSIFVADRVFRVLQSPADCSFLIASSGAVHGASLETNSVAVTTLIGCAWNVSNDVPWIEILSPFNHTNDGSVSYRVLANPAAFWRTGVVSIAEHDFTIAQSPAACTFALATNGATHTASAATNSIAVTTPLGCSWDVGNTNPWITIHTPLSNTNNGTVTYSVEANATALVRSGVVRIAEYDFTITQGGAPCSFALATNNAAHGPGAETNSVALTTLVGCTWSVSNGTPWITIQSSLNNTNGGIVSYSVDVNPTALSRTGILNIAEQNFTVTQSGATCSFTLATNAAVHGADVETNSVAVTTLVGCQWSISNGVPWVEILSPFNNTNSGSMTYRVLANPTALWRTSVVSIAEQDFTIAQSPAVCTFGLATNNATYTASAVTNSVAVTTLLGCTWSVSNGTPWIHILTSFNYSNSATVDYSVEENPTALTRTGVVRIAEQDFTIRQDGAVCSFALDSYDVSYGAGAETNSVSVSTLIGCEWNVANTNSWITIHTPLDNTNSGTVIYSVETNTTAIGRFGVVRIAEESFIVSQSGAGCDFALATNNASHGAGVETNSVAVTTLVGCPWDVNNTNSWIIIQSPLNNTNDGAVTYRVLTNTTALPRAGVVRIAQHSFTVTQLGADCTFALGTNNASFDFASATGSVAVTTLVGCAWSVSNSTPWITILSSLNNSNSGAVSYSVQSNSTALSRTGVVSIAGQDFTVTQFGAPCSFALATNNAVHGPGEETNSVALTTLIGCTWSVSNGTPWITILSTLNHSNSGVVSYRVVTNSTALWRTGLVDIAGQSFTIAQSGAACNFTLASNSTSFGFAAANGSVSVTTLEGCTWSVSENTPWITLLSATASTNSGIVVFSIETNSTAFFRTGVVTIAEQGFTVVQDGAPCSFTLATNSASHGPASVTNSLAVTTLVGCAWTVSNGTPWITIHSSLNNTNSGSVSYSVETNSTALSRTGVVSIAEQTFTVTQSGADCSFTLATNSAMHGAEPETNTVAVTTLVGCTWSVSNGTPWITLLSPTNNTNNGSVTYSVLTNSTALMRTGIVNIAGQNFTVTQAGADCTYSLMPSSASLSANLQTNSVSLTTLVGCPWSVSNGTPWITILSVTNTTNSGGVIHTVSYSVSSNVSVLVRSGVLSLVQQNFTVTQAPGLSCTLALQSSNWVHRAIAEPGFIGVISPTDCSWGVTNTNSWVTITSGPTITGSGHVSYWVATNNNFEPRSGVVNIGNTNFLVTQVGTGCTYRLSIAFRAHGNGSNSSSFSVTASNGCSWSVLNTNDWLTITTNATGIGTTNVTYSIAKNNAVTTRYGYLNVGGETLFIAQWGSGCGFAVNPQMRTHGFGMESGTATFSVNPNAGTCPWTVVNTVPWITNNPPFSGTGASSVTYTVAANPSGTPRTGVFTIGGAPCIVSQLGTPCSFVVMPTNIVHGGNSETGIVAVTTGTGCLWNVINPNAWISIVDRDPTNLTYSIEANPTIFWRTGIVNVAGKNITVSQQGAPCNYSITTNHISHNFGTEGGSVGLTTLNGCGWDVATTNNWIIITSPAHGTGNVEVTYLALTNPVVAGRTGYVTIANQTLEVEQAGSPCGFTISASSVSHGGGAEVGAVGVTADPLCSWVVENTNSWITITNGGAGSRIVSYSVEANPVFSPRSGVVLIAGQPLTITQAPMPCSYVLSPANATHGAAPDVGSISVTASNECSWTAVSGDSWITLTGGTNDSGNGTVTYTVATNGSTLRVGKIFIGGVPFSVMQAGSVRVVRAVDMNVLRGETNRLRIVLESTGIENAMGFSLCFDTNHLSFVQAVRGVDVPNFNTTFSVNPTNLAQGKVGIVLGLNFFSRAVFASGSNVVAEVLFRAAAGTSFTNTTIGLCGSPAGLEISDADALQLAATYVPANVNILGDCTYALNTNAVSAVASGGTGSVAVITQNGCAWTVTNGNSWIAITSGASGNGNGSVNFTVGANPTGIGRIGTMTIAGQTFTVNQGGQTCTYAISTNNQSHGADLSSGLVSVISISGCPWTVSNVNPWISFSPTNGVGSGDVAYGVAANTSSLPRSAFVTIAGQPFTISQLGAPCVFAILPTNKVHGFISETGLVAVTSPSGCNWTVNNTNSWILVTSGTNGSGDGSVAYTVGYNPNSTSRTGIVTIAGHQFTLSQPANNCPVTLSPSSHNHGPELETNSFNVTNVSACAWAVSNTNSWITVAPITGGTGNGTVTYRITANPLLTSRTGVIRVSGREFTVTQAKADCLYGISPTSQTNGFGVETGVVVAATFSDCNWTVQNTNSWIAFTSPTNGVGSANIYFTVTNNPSSIARTGVLMIANQPFTLMQSGAQCSFILNPTSAAPGFAAQTNTVTVTTLTGCRWTVTNTAAWITIQTSTNLTNTGSVTYSVASNATSLSRTGVIVIAGEQFNVMQAGAPCAISLNSTNSAYGYTATAGVFSVMAPVGCDWAVNNTNGWITITNGAAGTATGTVSYVVSPNPAAFGRTGVVDVAGRTFTVTQSPAPCRYTLAPTNNVLFTPLEGYGFVDLTTSIGCPWTLVNTNLWLDFIVEPSGSGNFTFPYFVAQNTSGAARTGLVQIADQTFIVRQSGVPCTFSLSTSNVTYGAPGTNRSVTVNTITGCGWTVSNTNSWISFPAGTNYSGGGALSYSVGANSLALARTGTVVIADIPFTIIQLGITCVYTLSTNEIVLASGNVTGAVNVDSSGGCTWEATYTNAWITIKGSAAGTNDGLVKITVQANSSPLPRSSYMTIAGKPFLVRQLGSPCSYALSSPSRLHGSGYETAQVSVFPSSSDCEWDVKNTNDWITVVPTNGVGTLSIGYAVQPNSGAGDRVGTFTIADQNYTVTQLGAGCTYTFLTNGTLHGALVETGKIHVVMPAGCSYSVVKTNSWITILSGSSGTSNMVSYSVTTNITGASRVGVITVGAAVGPTPFWVTQATVFCTFSNAPTTNLHGFESEIGSVSVTTSNPCPWTATKTASWITFLSPTNNTGSTNVTYSVQANPSPFERTSVVTVAGQPVTVRQAGLVCSYFLTPTSRAHSFLPTNGQVTVSSPTLCSWSVTKTASWITLVPPTNNVGPASVSYTLTQNPSATPRSAIITMAGQPFTVTQNGAPFLIASNKTLNCNASWNFDPPVLSGNCGTPGSTVAVVSTMTNFGCGRAYIATRVWNATDACANQVFATQVVTVVAGPPQLTSAPNKSVECNSGWTFDVPTAAEFCGGTNVTIRVPAADTIFTNGMCGNTKIITRTWEVTDSCNNTSLVSQTVFVVDTTPPVPIFSPGKTVECGSVWSFDRPTGVDGCNGTNVTVSVVSTLTNLTGSCGYTATRVWQLLDPCLNSSTCTQVVTAVDSTPPLLTCGSNKTVECGSGWSFNEPTVTDNCSDSNALTVLIIETVTNNAGFCGNTFVATRTWVAEDACGNLAFCSQTVQVVDTTPPVVLCASNKTSEYGQPWDFDLPTGTDGCGGTNLTIRIVSTATNTSGSCGATFTATRMWEVSDACSNKVNCAQMVTVRDTTPPAIACAADKAINCLGTWSFDFPTATDIASGTNVSVVPISTVTNGICGTDFTATRTWRATDSCGNSSICSQTVFGRAIVTVSGTVFCPTNYPPTMSDKRVPGARLIGPTNTIATSISDGTYNLAFDAVSNVTINTLAPITNPADGADGVTTLDISLVRRHILNIVSLDSPYKLLAADVDGNKAVSTLDLSFMRRLVLDPTNRPPAGLWRFIPSNYIFTNTLAPWSAPTNRSYPGVSADLGGQDFLAIKLGDVNNSVKSSVSAGVVQTLKKNLTPVVTFQVNNAASAPGTSVVVRVTVSNFSRVTTAQGTLTWNPAVLRFVATEQYGLGGLASGNFGKVLAPNGTLTFSWDDPTVQGVTVADDTAIFALRFDVIGSPGSASPVALVDSVTICEASVDLVACTFRALSGQVSVVDSNGLRLSAAPIANSTFGVGVPTVVGKSYILEYTDSLPATDWIPLPAVPGDGTIKILSDPSPKTQQRFYRLRVE